MRICAYVQGAYAKANYKCECMDTRQFVGLRVVMDALARSGYPVEWAGAATVHEYDLVLVSLTADCDWWSYIAERLSWHKGSYKVIIGGAGVLHVAPFLPYGDYFVLGRGEEAVPNLVRRLDGRDGHGDDCVIDAATFDEDGRYMIRQTETLYPHEVPLAEGAGKCFRESAIGCNHRCLFCGYTWHRRPILPEGYFKYGSGLFDVEDRERAMLDMERDPGSINWARLRSTAIDGMSERLRYMVNKRISRALMTAFVRRMIESEDAGAKPHQVKLFNIVGYPTETEDDWREYLETIREADMTARPSSRQWSIVLNATPFRAMPATPLACAPMSLRDYRGRVGAVLGKGLKGNLIYQGRSLWSVEGMGTDSLPTVMLSAIVHRGGREDADNVARIARSKAFWSAKSEVRALTLSRYFDLDRLFGEYTPQTLPSRYLRTYCRVEDTWARPAWRDEWRIKPPGK